MDAVSVFFLACVLCCVSAPNVAAAANWQETILWSFSSGTDGASPEAGLIDVNGTLYGTTEGGGHGGSGTVFSVDPITSRETVLHRFEGAGDGENPQSALIDVKGTLYGTTENGFNGSNGTVFALDLGSGSEKTVYSFNCNDQGQCPFGQYPQDTLIRVDGALYGTTFQGGASEQGTVFAVNLKTHTETVLHSFTGNTDGADPIAGLIDVNGMLYGTTTSGGTYGWGTVFSVDPTTGTTTILHSFARGADGAMPYGSLINVHGMLYGTTFNGGANSCGSGNACGTVYSLNPNTGAEAVVYSFSGGRNDGNFPVAGLIEMNGRLYGTTISGGSSGEGTVFSVDPTTGSEAIVHAFGSGNDGQNPYGNLLNVKGTLYGTTEGGGATGYGTAFALTKAR